MSNSFEGVLPSDIMSIYHATIVLLFCHHEEVELAPKSRQLRDFIVNFASLFYFCFLSIYVLTTSLPKCPQMSDMDSSCWEAGVLFCIK